MGGNKEIKRNDTQIVPKVSNEAARWMVVSLTILGENAGTEEGRILTEQY